MPAPRLNANHRAIEHILDRIDAFLDFGRRDVLAFKRPVIVRNRSRSLLARSPV